MSRSGSRSGSLRIALSRPRRPWRDGDTDATEESAVSSLEVDSDTPSEDAGPDRSEARSSIDTANDETFWESGRTAVDLWEEDQDPLCGKLSDDSDDDEAPGGKPRPWNFTDDYACSDEEHPEGGVLLALKESMLYAGQLLAQAAAAAADSQLAGVVHWSDGSSYEGYWKRGMPSGWGKYTWPSGNKYHGEYLAGKRHGVGRFVWGETGEVYVGDWSQDQRHGYGLYTWQDGARYEGQWRDGLREGVGMFHWMDGSRYEGYVANGSREGWGVMTSAKNEKFRGVWEQGNLVTVTRFSTPECLSAMEAASLAATRAWQHSLDLEKLVETAELAAHEAARQQTRAMACYPPVQLLDFYDRCQKRFGTANPLDEGSSDEEDTEMAKSDTYMGMNKLLRAINDTVERGAEGALEAVSNVMDKNLAAPPPLSDVDPGVLSVANSTGGELGKRLGKGVSRMWAHSSVSSVTSSTCSSPKPRLLTASSHSGRSDGDHTESQTDASSVVSEDTAVTQTRNGSSRSRGSLFDRCKRPKVRQ